MLTISEYAKATDRAEATITLPFDLRQKARLKTQLDTGEAIGLTLPRGKILRGGDKLKTGQGMVVEIKAAAETVTTVKTDDALLFARICYHLGNRHVPLEINTKNGENYCRYLHDHVLDDMLRGLGVADIICEQAPFEPESGAYSGGSHSHTHSH